MDSITEILARLGYHLQASEADEVEAWVSRKWEQDDLRDKFAAACLPNLAEWDDPTEAAEHAYVMADALLLARKAPPTSAPESKCLCDVACPPGTFDPRCTNPKHRPTRPTPETP